MEHVSATEWRAALRQCVRSRSLHVLREQVLLVHVESQMAFHPLHALLPRDRTSHKPTTFVAVLRLHEHVTALLRELQKSQLPPNDDAADDICSAVLESVVFVDRAVDPVSAKRANDTGGRVASAVPFFHPRQVNLSGGALCSFCEDEASAKVVLSAITVAVQFCAHEEEAEDEIDFLDANGQLVVVVEHDKGYIGQVFDGQVVSSIIRVKETPLQPSDVSLDSVLEAYEEDFTYQMEINGVTDQPQQLAVSVQAEFSISSASHLGASFSSVNQEESMGATLISSWSGLENIRSLYCKPPPNSSSLVCIGGMSCDDDFSINCDSAPAHLSSGKTSEPFPVQVRQTIAFLSNLENSINASTFQWQSSRHASSFSMDEPEQSCLLRKFRRFLADPDASTQEDTIDLNNTMELNVTFNFDRDEAAIMSRTDLDFLEKMWAFVCTNVTSAETAVALVQEFVATFAATRAIPLVHPANATRLGEFLKSRVDARRAADINIDNSLQVQLSTPQQALLSLFELGEWKLQRDIVSWFAQIGFTRAESKLIIDQFQLQEPDGRECYKPRHAAVQHLVDVCARAVSLGISGSLLRKLANDCLGYFMRHQHHNLTGTSTPTFVLPLNSFIPDRTRANLGDALFWDLDISFGKLMERKIRICEPSFHHKCRSFKSEGELSAARKLSPGSTLTLDLKTINQLHHCLPKEMLLHPAVLLFVQRAERNEEEYKIPTPVGLVQYECTTRRLTYFDA